MQSEPDWRAGLQSNLGGPGHVGKRGGAVPRVSCPLNAQFLCLSPNSWSGLGLPFFASIRLTRRSQGRSLFAFHFLQIHASGTTTSATTGRQQWPGGCGASRGYRDSDSSTPATPAIPRARPPPCHIQCPLSPDRRRHTHITRPTPAISASSSCSCWSSRLGGGPFAHCARVGSMVRRRRRRCAKLEGRGCRTVCDALAAAAAASAAPTAPAASGRRKGGILELNLA